MAYQVDFKTVATTGFEDSPFAKQLAGLRANEARYFWNKFKVPFVVCPIAEKPALFDWYRMLIKSERGLEFAATPLEISENVVDVEGSGSTRWVHVFYAEGFSLNVLYPLTQASKRAVGIKLAEDAPVPSELEALGFKFARQKSTLAGTIRGTYFKIKGDYESN